MMRYRHPMLLSMIVFALVSTFGFSQGGEEFQWGDDEDEKPLKQKEILKDGPEVGERYLKDLERSEKKLGKKKSKKPMDDFQLVDEELKKSGLRKKLVSEDELANGEIKKLKGVEEKKKRLEEARQKRLDALRQKAEALRLKEEQEAMKEWEEEVEDEVNTLPSITDEELRWNGLED